MDLRLSGKRALVTGSSSGIGAGIARMLAAEGCVVFVHGRNTERAETVARDIKAAGVAIGDLSTDEGADAVKTAVGEIDVLVNNSGGSDGTSALSWLDVTEKNWATTYQGNVVAAARMIRRFVPGMKERGWGRVIQVASAAATQPLAYGPDYGAAKGAIVNLTVSLAKSLGDCGVTANTISPGVILTPAVERWVGHLTKQQGWEGLSQEEIEKRLTRQMLTVPVGRIGRVEDIGHAVCMIASPNAGFMTGANVRVDGGQNQAVN